MSGKRNKLFRIVDLIVTSAAIIFVITAIVAGIIFVVKLINKNNGNTVKNTEVTENISENEHTESNGNFETDENEEATDVSEVENVADIIYEDETVEENKTVEETDTDYNSVKSVAVLYEDGLTSVGIFDVDGSSFKMPIDSENTVGVYFYTLIPFSGIEVRCAEGANIKLSLYAFNTDYETSLASSPIVSMKFTDIESDSWLASFFESVPAGEYIAVVSSDKAAELFVTSEQASVTNQRAVIFINGEMTLYYAPYLNIIFDGKTENGQYFN